MIKYLSEMTPEKLVRFSRDINLNGLLIYASVLAISDMDLDVKPELEDSEVVRGWRGIKPFDYIAGLIKADAKYGSEQKSKRT